MDIFIYTVDPTVDEPIMLINTFIGFDQEKGFGVMGNLFQKELLTLDTMNKKRIKVYINSPGGTVIDGYNIFNAILKSKTKVDTYCVGMAASIAGVIFQAGRNRVMADYSKLMYHNPYGANDDKGMDAIKESIVTMLTSRTGKTEDEIKKIMAKTTWIGADEALENGFCDEIENSGAINKKRALTTADDAKNFWQEADKILNNLFDNQKSNNMTPAEISKISNKLGLNPEASVDSIATEIDKIKNRAEAAEKDFKNAKDEADNAKNSLKEKEDKLADMQKEVDKLKDEIKKAKEDKEAENKKNKEKEEKETADKAKNYVAGLVTAGKIKNEAKIIEETEKKFVADFDGMKNLFESMPVNKQAAKIETIQNAGDGKVGSIVAVAMAKNYAKALENQ